MSTTQEQLLTAITSALAQVEERYGGYRKSLQATLTEVVKLERQHMEQHTDIRVKIRDQCAAAGDLLYRKTRDAGSSGHEESGGKS